MNSAMNLEEDLERVLTLDPAQELVESHQSPFVGGSSSTQQLLDELLGRFEDDDSPIFQAHGLTTELSTHFDA